MSLYTISLATAFIGTTIAAIWDLKTTEVPDQIPYAMIGIALLLFGYQSFIDWSYKPILNSLIVGISFLAFGALMYYLGQWGGADAFLLAAVGFLLPTGNIQTLFPFPLTFLFNLFFIGAGYMMLYAIIFSFLNKNIFIQFKKDLKASSRLMFFGSIGLFAFFFLINYYVGKIFFYSTNSYLLLINSLLPLVLSVTLFLIWKFAKVVEDHGFKKKIPVSKLKVGDMLLKEKKLIGITESQLRKIKKSGVRHVWIKEGVRFVPAFVLALLFTVIFGDAILLLFKFI
jgi:Flp pilus assembly protein protease CpaA